MKLSDIIALAKAGYSVSDVKELISLSSSEDSEPAPQEDKPKDEKTDEPESAKDTGDEAPQKSTTEPAKVTAIDDYKKQIDKLNQKIEELQQHNVHRDNSGKEPEKSPTEIIDDITRAFM